MNSLGHFHHNPLHIYSFKARIYSTQPTALTSHEIPVFENYFSAKLSTIATL